MGRFVYTIFMKNDLISISKAANLLGVSVKTVRRWCRAGRLKFIVTEGGHRRFHSEYLKEYINSKTSITFRSEK